MPSYLAFYGMFQTSAVSYEAAIISEAHGLITDMLADSNLPPHVVSGLRTVSNLLKPPETPHMTLHRPKISPLVSLTETSNYGSDSEDLPYTGERPSSLPKVVPIKSYLPPVFEIKKNFSCFHQKKQNIFMLINIIRFPSAYHQVVLLVVQLTYYKN